LLFKGNKVKAIVYIDGFNLYYLLLKKTAHRWLDLEALAKSVMPSSCTIVKVKYFTARASGRVKPNAPIKQQAYLNALKSTPIVETIYGRHQVSEKWSGLVQPPSFRPIYSVPNSAKLDVARVWKTEEKGSDVNLGVHLVRDAAKGYFDIAGVLTNDTDLSSAVEMAKNDFGKDIYLLSPVSRPAASLVKAVGSNKVRHVSTHVGPSRYFPDPVIVSGKKISKPHNW